MLCLTVSELFSKCIVVFLCLFERIWFVPIIFDIVWKVWILETYLCIVGMLCIINCSLKYVYRILFFFCIYEHLLKILFGFFKKVPEVWTIFVRTVCLWFVCNLLGLLVLNGPPPHASIPIPGVNVKVPFQGGKNMETYFV